MVISFKSFGSSLGTREMGGEIRRGLLENIKSHDLLVFDLEGVEVVSNSFADECFAKLLLDFELADLKKKTTFKNASPFVQKAISFAFNERLNQLKAHA
jgi:hypothetical protein